MYVAINGSKVRIAGSLHLLPAAGTIPDWINEAFEWSEETYLESNKVDLAANAVLPAGQSSQTKIPPTIWADILKRWPPNHPMGQNPAVFKPWLIAVSLALTGVSVVHGVEHTILSRTEADSLPAVKYLETVREFARLVDSIPEDVILKSLISTVSGSAEARGRNLSDLYAAWLSGNPEAVTAAIRASPLSQFPEVWAAIFTARNMMWIPRIEKILGSERQTVIYVGAGHLGGPEGLLALLKKSGHGITPLLKP